MVKTTYMWGDTGKDIVRRVFCIIPRHCDLSYKRLWFTHAIQRKRIWYSITGDTIVEKCYYDEKEYIMDILRQ